MPSTLPSEPKACADDWRWQLRFAVRTWAELGHHLRLSQDELAAEAVLGDQRPGLFITRYYLKLCDPDDPLCPLRRQVVPTRQEAQQAVGDMLDPLAEVAHQVAPDLVQRYPDRALLLVTDRCATYCRFCTRGRLVGRASNIGSEERWPRALDYLRQHPEIRDLIVSGGDPFVLPTERLAHLLRQLRSIESLETIRLATRTPAVLPQRITGELVDGLRPFHPLWVMTHFNHPRELTPAARRACQILANAGFPLMNQTVLLAKVNDHPAVLAELFRGLIRERVRPYYLLQADPVMGTGHLRTPLRHGLAIMAELQGKLSGIAIPKFVVDTPGGHGKVALLPGSICWCGPGVTRLLAPEGTQVDYIDPEISSSSERIQAD